MKPKSRPMTMDVDVIHSDRLFALSSPSGWPMKNYEIHALINTKLRR